MWFDNYFCIKKITKPNKTKPKKHWFNTKFRKIKCMHFKSMELQKNIKNVRTLNQCNYKNIMRYYDFKKTILFYIFPFIFKECCLFLKHCNVHICTSLTLQWLINFIKKILLRILTVCAELDVRRKLDATLLFHNSW